MAVRTFRIRIEGDEDDAVRAADHVKRRYQQLEGEINRSSTHMGDSLEDVPTRGMSAIERFKAKAATIGPSISAGLSSASASLRDFGSQMRGYGTQMSLALTLPILAGFKYAFDQATDLAEAQNVARLVFRENEAVIATFARNSARNLGMSESAALSGASALGGLLSNLGFANDETTAWSQRLLTLAADMGSAFNREPAEVVEAIGAALRGETEPIRAFNVMLDDASVRAKAVEMGLAATTAEVDANGKAQGALALILEQTGAVQGDFANTADGAANKQRILRAELENSAATIGQQLMPIGMTLLGWVENLTTGFASLSPQVQRWILIGVAVVAVLGPLVALIGAMATGIGVLLSPVALVVIAIAALAAGLVVAYQRSEAFRNVVDAVVQWVKSEAIPWLTELWDTVWQGAQQAWAFVQPILATIVAFFTEEFRKMRDWAMEVWPQIQEAISHAIAVIQQVIQWTLNVIQMGWRLFGDELLNIARATWTFIQGIVSGTLDIIRGIISFVLAIINGDWSRAWDAIKLILSGAWQVITSVVGFGIEWIKNILSIGWSAIHTVAAATWGVILDAISIAWAFIKAAVGGGIDWVQLKLGDTWDAISTKAGEIWSGITSTVSGAWDGIISAARTGLNTVIGIMNTLIRGVNRVLSWIPGVSDDAIPEIPSIGAVVAGGGQGGRNQRSTGRQLAAGGIPPVDMANVGPFVTNQARAIVGEGNSRFPEFVIPTDPQYRNRALGFLGQAASALMASGGAVKRYATGGVIGDAWGTVTGAIGSAVDTFREGAAMAIFGPIHRAVDAALNGVPWNLPRGIGKFANNKFYDWVKGKDAEAAAAAAAGANTGGGGSPRGLVGFAATAYNVFRNMFPNMTIGGWRARGSVPGSDHPKGKALDLMTFSQATADRIIRTFLGQPGAKYWIWNRQMATATGGWRPRGYSGPSPHTDHVHLSYYQRGGKIRRYHEGGILPEDITGVGPSGRMYELARGEAVTPAGEGGHGNISLNYTIEITNIGEPRDDAIRAAVEEAVESSQEDLVLALRSQVRTRQRG